MTTNEVWLECQMKFVKVNWESLQTGQTMYYTIGRSQFANGPFVVVDPATRKLRNGQGVEIALPSTLQSRLQPLVLSEQQ